MNYLEALEYVHSIAAPGSRPGLERVQRLLGRLDNPHHKLPCVHVGGTNGKGSVTAMLTAMLVTAGYRVGTFTSPHLTDYTERFCINGTPVTSERLAGLITVSRQALGDAAGDEQPTEFEIHTALALRLFMEEQVDVAVLEVGLGGRLDATNVVTPLVAVITNVSYDHMDYLGDSLRAIAGEKAGIIKPGVPVVTAAEGEALEVIEEACRMRGSGLVRVGQDVQSGVEQAGTAGQKVTVTGIRSVYPELWIPLVGAHQAVNAACAVAAAELLPKGLKVDEQSIREGLAATRWPGRFEVVEQEGLTVVLDAAHNAAAAQTLRRTLEALFENQPMTLLIGILADKDREGMVAQLAPLARHTVVTRPPTARAGEWRTVAEIARRYCPAVYEAEDNQAALAKALSLAQTHSNLLLITGSIYLLGALSVKLRARTLT